MMGKWYTLEIKQQQGNANSHALLDFNEQSLSSLIWSIICTLQGPTASSVASRIAFLLNCLDYKMPSTVHTHNL